MNKLTIFFIGVTVLVIGITGTLLGYKYFDKQPTQEIKREVVESTQKIVDSKPIDPKPIEPIKEKESDSPLIEILASIDLQMVLNAGFKNADIAIEKFNGLIFNDYDISEYQDDEDIKYIIKEGSENAGTINELIYPSDEIAKGVYAHLKTKMSGEDSPFDVNETNQYGDTSFFANNPQESNFVFLVVKFGNRLYTLHYPAKNHNKMKNLLQSL
ncbi:hypothetical protein J7J83_03275 [bacterium]|nr:hypothetical protein [bacterium]